MAETKTITLRRPDDWHVHLRDEEMLRSVANYTARQFGRAIVMPNLASPVTKVKAAQDYRERIQSAVDTQHDFTPLMTAYLTNNTDPAEIRAGFEAGVFTACKLYPAGATTNSDKGVTNISNIYSVLDTMQAIGMPLLLHGEVTDDHVDIFDREAVFIEQILIPLMGDFPELKIVFEHITTEQAAQFVSEGDSRIAATITPHHLMFNRNAIFKGGIRPHFYCLPVAKRERHRLALRKAATSGSTKFFLGTDSAPHAVGRKESDCGCAGLFNAPFALEAYAQVFEEEDALDKLEGFASLNGPQFYGLPVNEGTVTLEKKPAAVPDKIPADGTHIVPFMAGDETIWRIKA